MWYGKVGAKLEVKLKLDRLPAEQIIHQRSGLVHTFDCWISSHSTSFVLFIFVFILTLHLTAPGVIGLTCAQDGLLQ